MVEKKIPTIFTLTGDVIEVEESFAAEECSASGIRSGKPNLRVVEAGKAVAREIDIAIDRLSRLQRFVLMHVPKEEDGNNFGVAVQGQFYSKLSKYLKWCDAIQDEGKSYHHSRADILRRMELDEKLEYRETVCEKEDKAQLESLLQAYDEVGERVLKELPLYVVKLERELPQVFSLEGDIQQIEEAFAANECSEKSIRSGEAHPVLVEVGKYMSKAVEDALERLGQVQRYVVMHTPREEDGNNFGVAVQTRFYSKVAKYVKWCDTIHEGCKGYHAMRADILRKMGLDERLEVRENFSENDRKISSSKAVKTMKDQAPMGDLLW
ncbi:hypothetical protein FOL46_006728 [Perkinsus olseni]|uniref:Proteasome activator PA28 C-terminal domain-containing protein n=1 Tax=Perkinsus olseni TaxID=32597 RepID=A0A7J6LJJ5_PEROL|nr:hypothetical protein FOL46_006728 [Perkinsus olseni]